MKRSRDVETGIELRYSARRSIEWQHVGRQTVGAEADEFKAKELTPGGIQRSFDPGIPGSAVEWFGSGDFAGWIIGS